jgi:hypothetical protein
MVIFNAGATTLLRTTLVCVANMTGRARKITGQAEPQTRQDDLWPKVNWIKVISTKFDEISQAKRTEGNTQYS